MDKPQIDKDKETIGSANSILSTGYKMLPDDRAKAEYKTHTGVLIQDAISNALAMVNSDEEFASLLAAYAVQEANQVVTTLWRLQLLTPELEERYRTLPTMQEVADNYNEFIDKRKAERDSIMEANNKLANRERELDLFRGVINGMTKEESAKKYEEFKRNAQQAMGR